MSGLAEAEFSAANETPPAELPPVEPMLYPPNILEAFSAGALLDLRVRFAMQLLGTSPIFSGMFSPNLPSVSSTEGGANMAARIALNVSEALFAQATERGWCLPLKQDDTTMAALIDHAKRQGEAGAHQQLHGAKTMQEAQSPVATMQRPGIVPRGH